MEIKNVIDEYGLGMKNQQNITDCFSEISAINQGVRKTQATECVSEPSFSKNPIYGLEYSEINKFKNPFSNQSNLQ